MNASELGQCEQATIDMMLAELAAGGIVQLRDIAGARTFERWEEAQREYRSAYCFTHRKEPSDAPEPIYARVTVAQAQVLLAAGAVWIGSDAGNPMP